MLVDDFLPVYDVSDSVACVVRADVETTWDALMNVDLMDVGHRHMLVGVLSGVRVLPDVVRRLLRGERPPEAPGSLRLLDTTRAPAKNGGWTLLGEHARDEIALGLVGKFWRPVIEFADVTAREFRAFDEPGYAKTIYALSVRPIDHSHTLLTGVMRTATTDERARRWFRRYWTLGVGSGAHVLVNGVLDVTRETAEARMEARALAHAS